MICSVGLKIYFLNILSITTSLCTPSRAFSEKTRQILEIRTHHGDDFFSNFGSCFGITRPDQISNFLLYHLSFVLKLRLYLASR